MDRVGEEPECVCTVSDEEGMPRVIVKGYIEVPKEQLEKVIAALSMHIELTRAEEGCLIFDVSQDDRCPTRFSVYEEFIDHDAFELHQHRVKNSDWGMLTRDVKRHYDIVYN